MQVLLVKRTLILGSNSQTIAPPDQIQQPAQQHLTTKPQPMPTKLFQRGGAEGRPQGSTHTSLGNILTCQKESPRTHQGLFCNAPFKQEICIYGEKVIPTVKKLRIVQSFQSKRRISMLFHSQKHFRLSIHKSSNSTHALSARARLTNSDAPWYVKQTLLTKK